MSQPWFMLAIYSRIFNLFNLRFRNIFSFYSQDLHLKETLNSMDWVTISQNVYGTLILQDIIESTGDINIILHIMSASCK